MHGRMALNALRWSRSLQFQRESSSPLCLICGAPKEKHESQAIYKEYLCGSSECRGEWNRRRRYGSTRIPVACVYCGAKKLLYPREAKASKTHTCSKKCWRAWRKESQSGANCPNWRGGGGSDPIMRSIRCRVGGAYRSSHACQQIQIRIHGR